MSERELVQIETNEDIASVKDRLSFMRGKRVLLVWPEEGTALTRKLDLVLIQREAMRRAVQLAIVTHDTRVIRHARELNISTFETINASERGRWKRGRSRVFTNRLHRPRGQPEPEELQDVASRVRTRKPMFGRLQSVALRIGVLLSLISVVAGVAYVIVPSATVDLTLAAQIVEADVLITVSTDPELTEVDVENAILPSITIETDVEDIAIIPTTGEREVSDLRAVGSVVFINQTGETIDIPAGTVVSTSTGNPVEFRTVDTVTLPAGDGQTVEVGIEALPGSEGSVGNVPENLINSVSGPLENSVNVRNLLPTTGGQQQLAPIVTELDRELALGYVRQQLQDRAYRGLLETAGLRDTQFIVTESIRIVDERDDWTEFSAGVGDVADTLSVRMRATLQAIVVDEQAAQQIVFARMADQIPRGRVIEPASIEYERGPIQLQGGVIQFTLYGRGLVQGRVNDSQLQSQLANRSVAGALDYLLERVDLAEGTVPQIQLTPGWLQRMPILPFRIRIEAQHG